MQITLTVIAGPYTGQTFTFDRAERFLVGRSTQTHFRLQPDKDKDLRVSRLHFLVEVNPPLCRLHDLNSRNGTRVNGQRVASRDLANGDEIRIGQTILCVSIVAQSTLSEAIPVLNPLPTLPPPSSSPTAHPTPIAVLPGTPCLCCSREPAAADGPICAGCRQGGGGQPQPIPGKLLLLRELGKGGMGVVYMALRLLDQQLVAVKTIVPADMLAAGADRCFLREV